MEETRATVSTAPLLSSWVRLVPGRANIQMVPRIFADEAELGNLTHANKVTRKATVVTDGPYVFGIR